MPSTYKTPGVYVEEISKFPPSVAQVETAVPAFIGYTAIATKNGESLLNKPTRIYSFAEYEVYFGGAPDTDYEVYFDNTDTVSSVVSTVNLYLYESLRMFYANGGGKCYIISIGSYSDTLDIADFTAALAELEKEDEPTMILAPDAVLAGTGLYDFQQQALQQCAKLGDRVAICDLLKSNETVANETFADRVNEFRDKIGINDLKYGAAYAPYIKSSLPRNVYFRNLELRRGDPTAFTALNLEGFTSDNNITQIIFDLQNAAKASDDFKAIKSTGGILTGSSKTFEDEFKKLFDAYTSAANDAARITALHNLYAFTAKILAAIFDEQQTLPTKVATTPNPASKTTSKSFILRDDINSITTNAGTKAVFQTLIANHDAYNSADNAVQLFNPASDFQSVAADFGKAALAVQLATTANIGTFDITTLNDAALDTAYGAASGAERLELARKAVASAYTSFISLFARMQDAAALYEKTLDDSLAAAFGFYKNVLDKVKSSVADLPPSGAVAGVYATVDNLRGVWKAPANVSLSSVIGPTFVISNAIQDDLNVDTNAGKSINAIRAFTGKGTLVWGARTLAGNDNEWRYISVRRFFNMVEESVKKSSGQFVFEPNDANTWVKVKAMIENYLTILWRQGALAGSKPEQAFYVKVGLGETMTAIDILEGRMNVEIGMAAVRPAEFIILKFSHKMQEA
jgi:phage tail sheath protein FI